MAEAGWFDQQAIGLRFAQQAPEAHLKRLRELIRAAGAKGITKSELTRGSQWLKSRDRDDIIQTLIESGDVTTGMRSSATRQAMVYRLARWSGNWRDASGRTIEPQRAGPA